MLDTLLSDTSSLVALLLAIGGAAAWFYKRRLTGQEITEDQESIERAIKLKRLLDEDGMTIEEAKQLRDMFRKTKGGLIGAEAHAVAAKVAEAEEREKERVGLYQSTPFSETTVGMGIKAKAELEVLEATLELAVIEFADECTPARRESLSVAQATWREFRDKEAELASLLAEGGTMTSLLFVGRQMELTEQRIREIRLMQADANL